MGNRLTKDVEDVFFPQTSLFSFTSLKVTKGASVKPVVEQCNEYYF